MKPSFRLFYLSFTAFLFAQNHLNHAFTPGRPVPIGIRVTDGEYAGRVYYFKKTGEGPSDWIAIDTGKKVCAISGNRPPRGPGQIPILGIYNFPTERYGEGLNARVVPAKEIPGAGYLASYEINSPAMERPQYYSSLCPGAIDEARETITSMPDHASIQYLFNIRGAGPAIGFIAHSVSPSSQGDPGFFVEMIRPSSEYKKDLTTTKSEPTKL